MFSSLHVHVMYEIEATLRFLFFQDILNQVIFNLILTLNFKFAFYCRMRTTKNNTL
jgi:hypothetical protein